MVTKPRIIFASLLAPLAVLLLPAVTAVVALLFPEIASTDITDDAPLRGAGILLFFFIPVLYPLLAAAMATTGYVLFATNRLSRKNLLLISAMLSAAVSAYVGIQSPFGVLDKIESAIMFFVAAGLCLTLGALFWWGLAMKRP